MYHSIAIGQIYCRNYKNIFTSTYNMQCIQLFYILNQSKLILNDFQMKLNLSI